MDGCVDEGEKGREVTRDAMDAWNKGRSHTGGSMDRRWCTSHRPLLGLTFGREERRRKRRSENIHRHSDRCMLGWSDMLAGHLKLKMAHSSSLREEFASEFRSPNKQTNKQQEHSTKHRLSARVLPEKMSFSFITLRSLLDLLTAALSMICSGL